MVKSASVKLKNLGINQSTVDSIEKSFDPAKLLGVVTDALQSLASLASNLTVVILLLLFLAMDASDFPQKLSSSPRGRPAAVDALQSFVHGTRQYRIVSTVFGSIVAVLDSAFLAFTSGPGPVLVGAARVHHELHPERRFHHRPGATGGAGPADRRTRV